MNRVAGEALYLSGDRATGMDYIRRYLAAVETPVPTAAYIAGVDSYENGRYDEAVDLLGQVTGSADAAMAQTAYLYVGQALHHRGDIDAALLAFDKATKIDGGDASVRLLQLCRSAIRRRHDSVWILGQDIREIPAIISRRAVFRPCSPISCRGIYGR